MAVVFLKSPSITNRDAQPPVLDTAGYQGSPARLVEVYDFIASITAAASVLSVFRFASIPSNAVVASVQVWSGAQTAGAVSIGIYRNTKDGGLVAFGAQGTGSDVFFTKALSIAAAVNGTEVVFGVGTSLNSLALMDQPIWQAIGMVADPVAMLDVCMTVDTTAITTGTGAAALRVRYKI
jgi:hypothetical protein